LIPQELARAEARVRDADDCIMRSTKNYKANDPPSLHPFSSVTVIAISKFLERHSKAKRWATTYSRVMRRITGVIQRGV